MTLQDALKLRIGAHVTHLATTIPHRPIRVTDLWINAEQTVVCIRCASIKSSIEWLDATGYELPPLGKKWDRERSRWFTPEGEDDYRVPGLHPSDTYRAVGS